MRSTHFMRPGLLAGALLLLFTLLSAQSHAADGEPDGGAHRTFAGRARMLPPHAVHFWQGKLSPHVPVPKEWIHDDDDEPELPEIPDGPLRRDPHPTPATGIGSSVRLAHAATDDVVISKNVAVGAAGHNNITSSTGEPSVAVNGNVVFMTGNWYACVSTNGGTSFSYINPYTFFPQANNGFCCDQVAHYIPQADLFVWLLQYIEDSSHNNTYRLAFGTTAQVSANQWQFVDFTSQSLGMTGFALDFPELAVGANSLYMSANVFDSGGSFNRAIMVRIPVSDLAKASVTHAAVYQNQSFGGLRAAQNCGTRLYFASHFNSSTLRVFQWDEGSSTVNSTDVSHPSYSSVDYSSVCPDNSDWLGRADSRVDGAAKAGNELWFSWTGARGGANNHPHPYIQVVRLNTSTLSVISNIDIWNSDFAYAYGGLSSNSNNEVGISVAYGGGGTHYPASAVGIISGTLKLVNVATGLFGPQERNRWGDYFTVRPFRPNGTLFAATAYTMQTGGSAEGDADPRYVVFGRSSDVNGTSTPTIQVTAPNGGESWQAGTNQTITWQSANLSGNAKVELSRDNGTNWETLTTTAPVTGPFQWTVGGTATTQGRVRVTSVTSPTVSDISDSAFTIAAASGLSAPTNLVATALSSTGIRLDWTDNSSAESGYKVEIKSGTGSFQEIPNLGLGVDAHTVSLTGAQPNTAYTFRVFAYNGSGTSPYSNEAQVTTPIAAPAAPTNLKAVAKSATTVLLTFKDRSTNETGFRIEAGSSPTSLQEIGTVAANSTSVAINQLTKATTYYFRVRAYNDGGNSAYTSTVKATTKKK